MNKNPFRYGEPVAGDYFTARYREREVLISELGAGGKVLLTAPRHYGRTSLAQRVFSEFERQGVMTIYIDFERAYSLPRFVELYFGELLRSAFRQPKDLQQFLEERFPVLRKSPVFKISHSGELTADLSQGEDPDQVAAMVLDLAQLTAEFRRRSCVVCFDEISADGGAPEEIRSRIKEAVRSQTSVGYLLIDNEPGKAKDREGFTHLPLGKIEERYLRGFVKTRFENTGYRIDESVIGEILGVADGHPHYTQMLCRELWNLGHSGKIVSPKNLTHALEGILETHAGHYTVLWRTFSPHQKNLLLAVCTSGGKRLFSQSFVARHNLGSFSTVQKSLGRLLAMGILERKDENYRFEDPFFQQWLVRRMQ